MYKQSMIKLLFLIGILSGCTAIAHENQPDPTLINTSVHTIASTETSIVPDISSTPSRTTIPTLLPTPPATPSPIIEPTVTISMSEDFQIIDLCGTIYSDTTTIDTSFLAGIVTQDIDQKTDYVTVLSQKDEVAFRWNVPAGDWTATASPDGQWLAATFYDSFDTDGNATVVMVKVINPYTGESYQLQLDSELIQLYAGALLEFDWLSNESLYISKLDGVDPLFGGMLEMHYFVWSPFIGETTEFTVPLPDYVYMQIEPTLDPLLEYVTYSCESHLTCKQDILRVWDIFSGTLAWSVEKGFAHGFPDAGVWSWNGQMVAIFNVQDAQ
ncbi:MAG: hypothetical protein KC413_04140 [Anaerolineales bacterium]|nr:hypothetical protein [Anaerolineales bacterium]